MSGFENIGMRHIVETPWYLDKPRQATNLRRRRSTAVNPVNGSFGRTSQYRLFASQVNGVVRFSWQATPLLR